MLMMTDELSSLEKNNTWVLITKHKGAKIIGSKWLFNKKEGIPRVEAPRYKVRQVAKG